MGSEEYAIGDIVTRTSMNNAWRISEIYHEKIPIDELSPSNCIPKLKVRASKYSNSSIDCEDDFSEFEIEEITSKLVISGSASVSSRSRGADSSRSFTYNEIISGTKDLVQFLMQIVILKNKKIYI